MAPQAGFEPATLRLTGELNDISRPLPRCAARCRIAHRYSKKSPISYLRFVPLFAAICFPLLRRKGKKRATSDSRVPVGTVNCDKWWNLTVDPAMEPYGSTRVALLRRHARLQLRHEILDDDARRADVFVGLDHEEPLAIGTDVVVGVEIAAADRRKSPLE